MFLGNDPNVCNNKQHWNNDKYRCECKESINKGRCDDRFIWNPGTCKCECNKSFDVGKYLDYATFKCKNSLIDKIVEKCDRDIDRNKMIYN